MPEPPLDQPVFSVSRLTAEVRGLLEQNLGRVWLQGEISNLVRAASGHWYFALKDAGAQVRCAMFRQRNQRVRTPPRDGDAVLVQALVSLYEPRGEFQLVVEQLLPAGEGLLKARFEALKAELAAEGLFDPLRKRPLPEQIRTIGVVTSATGAAIHDILTVLKRRDPGLTVILYPTLVQGAQAAEQIAAAIRTANSRNEVDLLIVGRGGGSAEDLFCFNEAPVVRAIAASRLPVVSAVGHEVDISLADLAADLRAATPSAAAELVSRDRSQDRQRLAQLELRLKAAAGRQLLAHRQHWQQLYLRLQQQEPARKLEQQAQRLDELHSRLSRALHQQLTAQEQRLSSTQRRLQHASPERQLLPLAQRLSELSQRAERALLARQQAASQRFAAACGALQLVSPLATLSRGYAIAFDGASGQVMRSIQGAQVGQPLRTRLADGELLSTVTAVQPLAGDSSSTP